MGQTKAQKAAAAAKKAKESTVGAAGTGTGTNSNEPAAPEVQAEGEKVGKKVYVPDQLPVQSEIIELAGKRYSFGIHFIAKVSGITKVQKLDKDGEHEHDEDTGKGLFTDGPKVSGEALYNERGQRISPVYGPEDILAGSEESSSPTNALKYIRKAAAVNNARRRQHMLPGDAELSPVGRAQ